MALLEGLQTDENLTDGANDRIEYLDVIFKNFPNSWFAYSVFFEQAALRYARARVGFNISVRDDLNMRFFEVMSYGNCLVTNRDVVGWDDLGFVEDEHFLGYKGEEEMVDKVIGTSGAETVIWAISANGFDVDIHDGTGTGGTKVFSLAADNTVSFPQGLHCASGVYANITGTGILGVAFNQ